MAYNEPRLTVSTKDCECPVCKEEIKKGQPCYVVPKEKKAYHTQCYKKRK